MDNVAATSIVVAASNPALKKLMSDFIGNLSDLLTKAKKRTIDRLSVEFQRGFDNYLANSLYKCNQYKTIVNPTVPLNVLENYISLNLSKGDELVVDLDLIADFNSYRLVCVTGLAGCGKSMLMKYLTLCSFDNKKGVIPLLVELRHLNEVQNVDLLTFARISCAVGDRGIDEDQFKIALQGGLFFLILDGFDEIKIDKRESLEKQILLIAKNFPKVNIIVSSRPDDRFGSWQSFHVFEIKSLEKHQTIRVIECLPYDESVKKRFIRLVNDALYDSHTSFLSSPLLTSIMLLTFESFAEIPDKIHAFYSQAFDTLFQKHDAQKEQFKRQTHTGLSREEFRTCVAAFCMMSYLEEAYSIAEEKLLEIANRATILVKSSAPDFSQSFTGDQENVRYPSPNPHKSPKGCAGSTCYTRKDPRRTT